MPPDGTACCSPGCRSTASRWCRTSAPGRPAQRVTGATRAGADRGRAHRPLRQPGDDGGDRSRPAHHRGSGVPPGVRLPAVEAGGDDRHPHLVTQGVVDDGAEDDVGVGVRGVGDQRGGLVDLEQAEVRPAGDRQQHAVRALHRGLEQRAGDGLLGGQQRAVVAAGAADAHERRARPRHDRLDVGEVEVDQAGRGDQVGDALDTGQQHLVGGAEGVHHADVAVAELEQAVVRDHDERVALVAQLLDAGLGLDRAPLALEGERPRDHADGQGAELARDRGDDGRPAGTRAAALAGRHEDHVGALEHLFDLLAVVLGGLPADIGLGAGAEAPGQLAADVELDVGVAHQQGLGVGVDRDELDALEADLDHPVDRVHPAAADAHDLDDRQVVVRRCHAALLN